MGVIVMTIQILQRTHRKQIRLVLFIKIFPQLKRLIYDSLADIVRLLLLIAGMTMMMGPDLIL